MKLVSNLSNESKQLTKVVLADGSVVAFTFTYLAAIERWVFSLSHPELDLASVILCAGPNILRDFRHLIPFGLGCYSTDGADPFYIEDFASGRITLYVLDAAEVEFFEGAIFGPTAVAA